MPISTFSRRDNHEDQFLLKPAALRDTHSEGKVAMGAKHLRSDDRPFIIETASRCLRIRKTQPSVLEVQLSFL
jgi:hypothetical protein